MNSAMFPPKPSHDIPRPRTAPTKNINQQVFLDILCSLNKGAYDTHYPTITNMDVAIQQYNKLVDLGVIGGEKL